MSFFINWDDREFKNNIDKIIKAFENPSVTGPVGKGVLLAGQQILSDSRDIIPFDVGRLSQSGRAEKVYYKNGDHNIEVSFNTDYAAKVHEDLTLNISQMKVGKSGKQRQQKYLEQPMKENAEQYGIIIAQSILKYL